MRKGDNIVSGIIGITETILKLSNKKKLPHKNINLYKIQKKKDLSYWIYLYARSHASIASSATMDGKHLDRVSVWKSWEPLRTLDYQIIHPHHQQHGGTEKPYLQVYTRLKLDRVEYWTAKFEISEQSTKS